MPKIDIRFAARQYLDAQNAIVVVIDVLRATSTITAAFGNGCEGMIPVSGLSEALTTAMRLKNVLLAGERDTQKPEHFDLGNSPLEFTPEKVAGKTIVFTTTNGTKALRSIENAAEILIASCLNLKAITSYLAAKKENLIFYCAGNNGAFSLEDTLCASIIMHELSHSNSSVKLSDAAIWTLNAAEYLLPAPKKESASAVFERMRQSEHAQKLVLKGMEADVVYCAKMNIFSIIPKMDKFGPTGYLKI